MSINNEMEATIRQAIPADAAELLTIMKKIGQETPYLVMDERGLALTEAEMQENLANLYESLNNVLLVAIINNKIVGTASVKAANQPRMEHIGEVGISLLRDYWGYGLGTVMMKELIDWAQASGVIRRLELTVQERNQRAIHVYRKLGFVDEALMPRGAKTDDGEFLNVHLMRLLID